MSERFKLQHINDLTDQEYMRLKKITDNGELITLGEVVDLLNEQQTIIDKQNKVIREVGKVLTDPKNYQSVISIKYAIQYAIQLLKGANDDE